MSHHQAESKAIPPRQIRRISPRLLPLLGWALLINSWGVFGQRWLTASADRVLISKEYYYLTARSGLRHQSVVYVSSVVGPISPLDAKRFEASFIKAYEALPLTGRALGPTSGTSRSPKHLYPDAGQNESCSFYSLSFLGLLNQGLATDRSSCFVKPRNHLVNSTA